MIHPGLVLIVGALVLPLAARHARAATAIVALPLAALALVWQVPDGAVWQLQFLDYTITPLAGRQAVAAVRHRSSR